MDGQGENRPEISSRMMNLLARKAEEGNDLAGDLLKKTVVSGEKEEKQSDIGEIAKSLDDPKAQAEEAGILGGEEHSTLVEEGRTSEQRRKEQISEDLSLVLAPVPKEVRSDTTKNIEYADRVTEAKDRLLEEGIGVDKYIWKVDPGLKPEDRNLQIGQNKAELREIVHKMTSSEQLSEEQKEIAKNVGLMSEDLTADINKEVRDGEPIKERKAERKDSVEEKIQNILSYPRSSEKRKALASLKEKLTRSGEPLDRIGKVDKAVIDLKTREDREIQEYADRGEMRPELKEAVETYYAQLGKKYDSGGNMVNIFQMSPDFELTKSLTEMRELGSDGERLATDLEKELFDIGVLHDLRLMINSRGAVDENMLKYASMLKGEQFDGLIHLQDRLARDETGQNDFVVKYLAAIDEEARGAYNDRTGGGFFKLEDPQLESRVLSEVKGDRLNYLIARDLYRVTGGEARYGVAGYAHRDENKGWIIEKNGDDNNGAFFRKAMNKRRDFAGAVDSTAEGKYVLRYWPELWKHLDPGVSSFWEKLWKGAIDSMQVSEELRNKFTFQKEIGLNKDVEAGIPQREYAVLTVDSLRSLRLGVEEPDKVCLSNEINFNGWMDEIGKVAGTMSKETQFMGAPNFKSFQSILGADYYPIIMKARADGRKINRDQYLLERLGDLVEYSLISNSMNPTQIAAELEEYRKAGFLFKSESEMVSFMKRFKIPVTGREKQASELRTFGKKLTGEPTGRRQALDALGKIAGKFFEEVTKDI